MYPVDEVNREAFLDLEREPRTQMNELTLSRCRDVPEAVGLMERFVRDHPDMMGGNHFLADRAGNLAIVERCEG